MQRDVTCEDEDGNSLSYRLCRRVKPRNTKRCSAGPCPRWHKGKWSKVSWKSLEFVMLESQTFILGDIL